MTKDKKYTTKKDPNPVYKHKELIDICMEQYDDDYQALQPQRDTWEDKEAFLLGETRDGYSSTSNASKINSQELQTALIKRTNSVVAQLPTGKVQAMTKNDTGKNIMMNFVLEKYVIPNANTQGDQFTKTWWMEFYSNVYGTENVMVDYIVSDRYIGPDFYVLNQRDFIPQKGKVSIDSCNRVFIKSRVSREWLLGRNKDNWKNIDELLRKVKGSSRTNSNDEVSYVEQKNNNTIDINDKEDVEIITRYECDRWVTFSKEAKLVIRECENLHKNDELPVVSKSCFPLKDRFYGLGEFERNMTLQHAMNSLINLYMAGVKMSIFPPLKIYLPDVVGSTILNEAGAKWILKNMNPGAISEQQRSPLGLQTFQATYGFLKGALLGNMNTTDTTVSSSVDVGMGRTPQALKMQESMDQGRTNFSRILLEKSVEKIYDKYVDLIATKQEKPIKMQLSKNDIDQIGRYNPDAKEMFENITKYDSGNGGEVVIKPDEIKNTKYKYFIDTGTTTKKDDQIENQVLSDLTQRILSLPGAAEEAKQTGKVTIGNKAIDIGESFKRIYITSGVQDAEKIISDIDMDDVQQGVTPGMQPSMPPSNMPQMEQPPQMPPMQMQQPMQGMPQDMPAQGMDEGMSPEAQALLQEFGAL